ncbi:MAG: secondary thiamine-phosphate synthase enzyme YjbQ [Candidatus Sericytochromatia bacterium]
MTDWIQKELCLKAYPRGFHLITREVEAGIPEIRELGLGWLNVFIRHTSASLTINENADNDVRRDFESYFNNLVPENAHCYRHTAEGPDDMPAHLKASILGPSLLIPVCQGRLGLGTWQGIYLCEHRNDGGPRKLLLTLQGQ